MPRPRIPKNKRRIQSGLTHDPELLGMIKDIAKTRGEPLSRIADEAFREYAKRQLRGVK